MFILALVAAVDLSLPPYPVVPGDAELFARHSELQVDITFSGKGKWSRPNGTFEDATFRRRLAFRIPLSQQHGMAALFGKSGGYERMESSTPPGLAAGSPLAKLLADAQAKCGNNTACMNAEFMKASMAGKVNPEMGEKSVAKPNHERFLNLTPVHGNRCGRAVAAVHDHAVGKFVGDPGQPPLVPYTADYLYKGAIEGNYCNVRVSIDLEQKRIHLHLGGALHAGVKTVKKINGHQFEQFISLEGNSTAIKDLRRLLTFYDLPVTGSTRDISGRQEISPVGFEHNATKEGDFPITATIQWRVIVR
jgi:hypothetical protein